MEKVGKIKKVKINKFFLQKSDLNSKKSSSGITLIALIVTIIVLLLLAGVTIATLTGETGILSQAQNASQLTEIARVEEEANLILMESKIGNRTNGQAEKSVSTILSELKKIFVEERSK